MKEAIQILHGSIQRALIGEVTGNWAAVTCSVRESTIRIVVFVWGSVTSEDSERIGIVGGEVAADFPPEFRVYEECYSLDEHPLSLLDFWAFLRAEAEPLVDMTKKNQ